MYRCYFHLEYKNESNDFKNQILSKLQEEFPENWSMRYVRLLVAKTYNKKKERMKSNIPLNVCLELFINITFVIFTFHISI